MAWSFVDELEAVVAGFEAAGISYAFCGGVAVIVHGHVRATADFDVLVRPEDLPRTIELAKRLGFDISSGKLPFGAGTEQAREVVRQSKIIEKDWLMLDIMPVTEVWEAAWASRISRPWAGGELVVVSLDGLAEMKRLSGRYKDLGDLEALGLDVADGEHE